MTKKFLLVLSIFLAIFVLAGCEVSIKKGATTDGGVYKTTDKGEKWTAKNLIPSISGTPGSISGINVKKIYLDPKDDETLYLVTKDNGLFFSYNNADYWQTPRRQPTEMKSIQDLAIDPKDNCNIYVSAANKIFKTENCAREWKQIYYGSKTTDIVNALVVDWYNSNIIYAGTKDGDLMQSNDAGLSWATIKRASTPITKIVIDPYDSRIIYFATTNNGLFKTSDQGKNWTQIKDQFKSYKDSLEYRDFVIDQSKRNSFFWAAKYGILKTSDGGATWEALKLIEAPGKENILAVIIDRENSDGIYYTTSSAFVKSLDGGKSWIAKKLPSTRAGSALAISSKDPKVIYLGVTILEK
ncbi:MAG: YCF48-related protein [Patescibacteria group bacterium]|jgi:photosystem II stability/assembly factor-like uncharacterized protein